MQFVQPALGSEDPYKRKAALIALAVLAEGCADYIRSRLIRLSLEQFSLECGKQLLFIFVFVLHCLKKMLLFIVVNALSYT